MDDHALTQIQRLLERVFDAQCLILKRQSAVDQDITQLLLLFKRLTEGE